MRLMVKILLQIKKLTKCTALFCFSFFIITVSANDLSQIQKEIKQQEQTIAQQKREHRKLQSTLKTQEKQINNVINQLRKTESDLQQIGQNINTIEDQIRQLQQQEMAQKAELSKQLDAAYREALSARRIENWFFNQDKDKDRLLMYYKYLTQEKAQLINELKQTQAELAENKRQITLQQREQQTYLSAQRKQQQELQEIKTERESTLSQLNSTLNKAQNRLEVLKENENALEREVQRATERAQQQEKQEQEAYTQRKQAEEKRTNKPYNPTQQEQQLMQTRGGLGKPNKQYSVPVAGNVLYRFGSSQGGELRWKGMVIGAKEGSAVKSIASGRVSFTNWLEGYGMVVAIDHGNGDISLYGYNQAISVQQGAYVRAGQKIAEVGSSSDIGRPALFFQITRRGVPLNPASWLK